MAVDTSTAPVGTDPWAPSLVPYLPRIVVDWLRDEPGRAHRRVDGSLVFADISGFTALTERLAGRGKAGAEEMRDILDTVFERLLEAAYAHGGGVVKWGGDAVLLLFEGAGHAQAAAGAALGMQRRLRRVGRLSTSRGTVTLRMSVGLHSGPVDCYLVGGRHRELVVTGAAVTAVLAAEKAAAAGEIVVSPAAAASLAAQGARFGAARDGGVALRSVPGIGVRPPAVVRADGLDLRGAMSPRVAEHVLAGAVESEHRRVAVGFVRFSGTDGAGPRALVARLAGLVETADEECGAHGVTFLGTDVDADGGKLILVAGAPAATGDDESRLLGAVRAILDRAGAATLRGGVSAGRVFAGDFGPAHRRTYTVFGDCVNLAARLMAAAGPGELVTTPAVLAAVRTPFETRPLPPLHLKGKSRPVPAVRVERAGAGPGRGDAARAHPPAVGRGAEAAVLAQRLDAARAGRGQVVEILGAAGVGKTRLVGGLLDAVRDARVLAVRGEVYDAATPYRSVRGLLRTALAIPGAVSAADLTAAVGRVVPELAAMAPLIGVAAGVEVPETPEVAALDRRFRKARLEAAVADLLAAAVPGPLVLVAEDLHLFDEASADVVRRIADAAVDRPWLVLGTRRTGAGDDAPPLAPRATRLELAPLDRGAARDLLYALTADAPLTPHVQDAILARAAGNPLFLRELVAGLRDGALDVLPDSIEGVIATRIDRLAPPDRSMLRAAAVLGMRVDLELLGELLGTGPPDEAEVAARLGEFVAPEGPGLLRFGRQLVRDTAYEGLAYRRRTALHRHAGDLVTRRAGDRVDELADLVAVHYAAAGHWPATWHFARIAGRRARARYALAEADVAYALAAAAAERLTVPDVELVEVLEALGDVRHDLGDPRADAAYRAARGRARGDATARARLLLKTARVCERGGRYPQALRWLSRGRSELAAEPDGPATAMRARLDARTARIRHVQGRDRDAVRRADAALAAAERCGDLRTVAAALEVLDWAHAALGRLDDRPRAVRALAIYTELGDVGAGAHIRNGLGARAYFRGRWGEAARHYRLARADFERVGDVANAAVAAANLAEVLVDQNRLVEAEENLRAAMRVWQAVGAVGDLAWGRLQLGRVAARAGRADDALALFRCAREHFASHHEAAEVLAVDAATAECAARAGRPDEALALAGDALRRARSFGGLAPALPALHRARGVALLQRQERAGGRAALLESLAAARARQAGHDVTLALTALLEHGLAGDETATWTEERDRLAAELGIRDAVAR